MKKIVFLGIMILAGFYAKADGYQIEFRGSGAGTIVEKVTVENLTRGTSISMTGSDILNLKGITAVNHLTLNESFKIFPNPSKEFCIAEINNTKPGEASIEVLDLTGRIVGNSRFILSKGKHSFRIEGLNRGLYIIKMNSPEFISVGKLVSEGSGSSGLSITHTGTKPLPEEPALKSISSEVTMDFNDGELLKITGFSGNYSTVIMNSPVRSETIIFPFIDCTDADGNHYSVVKIGTQYWMAENLKTTRYRNGDPISLITEGSKWPITPDGAYCHYDNNPVITDTYGLLYNWKAAADSRNVAPEGWRVPTYDEWKSTLQVLKDGKPVGGKLKETGTAHWISPNFGASNTSGFTALPGGYLSLIHI